MRGGWRSKASEAEQVRGLADSQCLSECFQGNANRKQEAVRGTDYCQILHRFGPWPTGILLCLVAVAWPLDSSRFVAVIGPWPSEGL